MCVALLWCASGCGGEARYERPAPEGGTDAGLDAGEPDAPRPVLALRGVEPSVIDPAGGSRIVVTGAGFTDGAGAGRVTAVSIGGVAAASFEVRDGGVLAVTTAPTPVGEGLDVVVSAGADEATLAGAVDCWSPDLVAGARLFDAAHGVAAGRASTQYEWQRLTAEIHPAWRPRDGNTLTWLPSTGRFWMVGGWNGLDPPDGFGPGTTTNEVWSSPDGVTWALELEHGHGAFQRRHAHNVARWNGRLWMVGGDTWQGFYNHDVVSSDDGAHWTVELGPGATEPPWSERALQTIGVYDGKLWMAGGQDLLGDPTAFAYHNDVWVTEDGVTWTQVVADGPASDTRWAGCGVLDGLVEFRGELWLVGCAQYNETLGPTLRNEVWSTTDGATWTRHAEPPWAGKSWPNVVVWDDQLWILFGWTFGDPDAGWSAGNANEVWRSSDGETWVSLPPDAPVPGSHAQGVAVHDDFLLLAGGNYSFGTLVEFDRSAWRLVPFRGGEVQSWRDRGGDGLVVRASAAEASPVLVDDAFGPGAPGLHFDGSWDVLDLDGEADTHLEGRSVFWIARAPYLPAPYGWMEVGAPVGTVLGGPAHATLPVAAVGLSDGAVVLHSLNAELGPIGELVWTRHAAGAGLQEGPGQVRFAGVTQTGDGSVQVWIDGATAGAASAPTDVLAPSWTQIGGGMTDAYYGPNTRFAGTLGAIVILPSAAEAADVDRIHRWARGRFGAP